MSVADYYGLDLEERPFPDYQPPEQPPVAMPGYPEPVAQDPTVPPKTFPAPEGGKFPTGGYTAPTTPPPAYNVAPSGDWQSWFFGLVGGQPPTPQTLLSLEGQLAQYGIKVLKNAQGVAGKIQLPDGQIVDVIEAAGLGGKAWQWMTGGGGPGGGGGSFRPGPGDQFDDPYTQYYEQMLKDRIGQLQQPYDDPMRQQWLALMAQQQQMLAAQQQYQLQENERLKQRRSLATGATDEFVSFMRDRADRLMQPAYTGAEQEIIRTQYLDPLARDRDATKKRALENVGSRGFDPTSGIAQELFQNVEATHDRLRAEAQGDIAYRQINEQRSREAEAQQLMGMIPMALEAAAQGDLEFLTLLNDAVNQLGMGQIGLQGQAAGAEAAMRGEDDARANEALGWASQLYELPYTAAQQGMAALGQAPNPASLTSQAIQLAQLRQNQSYQNQNMWLGLGNWAGNFFGSMFGG